MPTRRERNWNIAWDGPQRINPVKVVVVFRAGSKPPSELKVATVLAKRIDLADTYELFDQTISEFATEHGLRIVQNVKPDARYPSRITVTFDKA